MKPPLEPPPPSTVEVSGRDLDRTLASLDEQGFDVAAMDTLGAARWRLRIRRRPPEQWRQVKLWEK